MKVKSESEIAQSCPALSDPMDCSLPGSSVLGDKYSKIKNSNIKVISQYRIWEVRAKNGPYNPIYSLDLELFILL